MKKFMLILVLPLLLAACDTVKQYIPASETSVYALQASLATLETGATAYISRPTCGRTKAVLCKDMSIARKMNGAGDAAYLAVTEAEKAVNQNTLQAAETAVAAYGNIIEIVTPLPSEK